MSNSPVTEIKTYTKKIGGRDLTIEVGKLAFQANGSVTVRYGDTLVLGTAVMKDEINEELGYFPLYVDYEERLYAAGRIKGSRFIKREGRPTDEAIVTSRVVDRSLRPNFPKGMLNEIQVIITVLSVDGENDSDIASIIAGSAALSISNIPFGDPISACRVGFVDGTYILNPTFEQREKSTLDLIVSGTGDTVCMLEAGANEVSEEEFIKAVEFAQDHLKETSALIKEMVNEIGEEKNAFAEPDKNPEIIKTVSDLSRQEVDKVLYEPNKKERNEALNNLKKEITNTLVEKFGEDDTKFIKDAFDELVHDVVRANIIEKDNRIGGRKLDEVRPLSCDVGILPRTHGSGLFQRGETQVLTICTLDAPGAEQTLDGMEEEGKKRFFHHYNFPPYSVGEVGMLRGPGRREIGHGALAERAIQAVMPQDKEKFPYTVRLVSEVLSSNGSTSMGSVCGSTLSLMDAGVKIKSPVSGIAMGLMTDKQGKYKILSDIQDLEDFGGDMDFKVAGTKDGITAVQMDVKIKGINIEYLKATLDQSRAGRMHILDTMLKTIDKPRDDYSPHAPRIVSMKIDPEKIRIVIGPGGKMINEIIDETGVDIDIEDDGLVMISSTDAESSKKAVQWVENLTREPKIGERFEGKVVKIMDFGAFVEILPGKEGLVHISQLSDKHVKNVHDVVKVGDTLSVVLVDIDDQHRLNLSHKAALSEFGKNSQESHDRRNPRSPRPSNRPPRPPRPR